MEKQDRKKKYKDLLIFFEKILFKLTKNNALSGFLVYFLHVGFCSIALFYIFLGDIDIFFYISVFIWLLIFAFHFYFKGCILVKLERHLWNTKEWYGPWVILFTPLKFFNIKLTKNTSENIFVVYGILILIYILFRIFTEQN
jgi:hypothetical protein